MQVLYVLNVLYVLLHAGYVIVPSSIMLSMNTISIGNIPGRVRDAID